MNVKSYRVLCKNIDQKLRNILHGPIHYTIDVTRVFNGHERGIYIYSVVIT